MPKYLVWETDYPDEGSALYDVPFPDEARRKWLEETGTKPEDAPDVCVAEATPAMLELREAQEALDGAQRRLVKAQNAVRREIDEDFERDVTSGSA